MQIMCVQKLPLRFLTSLGSALPAKFQVAVPADATILEVAGAEAMN